MSDEFCMGLIVGLLLAFTHYLAYCAGKPAVKEEEDDSEVA